MANEVTVGTCEGRNLVVASTGHHVIVGPEHARQTGHVLNSVQARALADALIAAADHIEGRA